MYNRACHNYWINLLRLNSLNTSSEHVFKYNTYGVTCVEAEIDVLTGETEILRADILYDCGERYSYIIFMN